MLEMEVMHSSQQAMDLIDILWRQDIDLGARREVFDYNHRQKEHELQRQRELEEEKQLQLLREQEKALLAQLQLDEETGEYVPRRPPSVALQPAAAPLEVSQNVSFTEDDSNDMSFDECLQLLAERFPVEETENPSVCLNAAVSPTIAMMSPEQPALPAPSLAAGPVGSQRMSPDLEQALMEILSLPELQQCLNMQMDATLGTPTYPLPNSPELPEPQYSFYPLPDLTAGGDVNTTDVRPDEFLNVFSGAFPSVVPPENLSQMNTEASELNTDFSTESLGDMFYPSSILGTEASGGGGQRGFEENQSQTESEIKPLFKHMDFYSLSPGDAFDRHTEKAPDSDSGVSFSTSPHSSSPDKSVCGDGSFGFSDSELEEMEHDPGSTESDHAEMFLNFQPDDLHFTSSLSPPLGQQQEKTPAHRKTEAAENSGHDGAPFTKDKQKKRSEGRLTRDEQRAKALRIPFTVDTIINLPVDDFNTIMSKHQLNDSQLALVRDIRRRGKNKVAAQNCRKRKMENIVGLEGNLDSLKEEKERLLSEKKQNIANLREMKQQLSSLYLEVFSMLRDEKGNTYSPSEYSLQQSADGSIFLVPRIKKT